MSATLADTTATCDVVCVEAPGVCTYVRVLSRRGRRLRVSWHGVDYLAVGRQTGTDAGGTAIWSIAQWEPWGVAPPGPRRRRAKGARA